jgi:hypothetical protein
MTNGVVNIESGRRPSGGESRRREKLRGLGIYVPPMLEEMRQTQAAQPYLVDGLLRTGSINLLVGDSGLGKTPLAVQIGVSVASGVPLFGLAVQKGSVLYCDAESDVTGFCEVLVAISEYLGLAEPPLDFYVWSPNWDESSGAAWDKELTKRVSTVKPLLVIADPLRMFWPDAESKNTDAAAAIASLRELSKSNGTTWLLSHHRRKVNQNVPQVDLEENPHAWFQETAGAHALINQSDTRLGVVPGTGQADLVVGGFRRGAGPITPLHLARATKDDGQPIGYRLLVGAEQLRQEDRAIFRKLGSTFRFKDVADAVGGTSGSNAKRVLDLFVSLALVQKKGKTYRKTYDSSKSME